MSLIDQTVAEIFASATEMTGAHAPWEIDLEKEYIRNVEGAVREALAYLPAAMRMALAIKLRALREELIEEVGKAKSAFDAGPVYE